MAAYKLIEEQKFTSILSQENQSKRLRHVLCMFDVICCNLELEEEKMDSLSHKLIWFFLNISLVHININFLFPCLIAREGREESLLDNILYICVSINDYKSSLSLLLTLTWLEHYHSKDKIIIKIHRSIWLLPGSVLQNLSVTLSKRKRKQILLKVIQNNFTF